MRENKNFSSLLWLSITSGPLFPSITNQETVSSLPSHNLNTQNLSITSHKVKHNSRNNKIGRQLSLFHLLWHELQRGRVDTVAESCWLWPVRKDMTQMSCTLKIKRELFWETHHYQCYSTIIITFMLLLLFVFISLVQY